VRSLVTRVGKLELRVPQDRQGRFCTQLFERYQRSEKALVAALAEMYVQGVSTRKVKAITEELCGQEFSASSISAINQRLDEELERFMRRRLEEDYPYLIVDARYEKVRQEGVIRSRAVLVASGYRPEPKFSTAISRRPSVAGIRLSATKVKRRPHDQIAPEFCTLPSAGSGPNLTPCKLRFSVQRQWVLGCDANWSPLWASGTASFGT